MVFLILATALCATVFMQMFGGDYADIVTVEDPEPRFDTFWEAFVALIIVYTSETWTVHIYKSYILFEMQVFMYLNIGFIVQCNGKSDRERFNLCSHCCVALFCFWKIYHVWSLHCCCPRKF